MTQEEMQFLLKDLCARLPYKVIVKSVGENKIIGLWDLRDIDDLPLPYLRPFSSITHEEILDAVKRCMGGVVYERGGRYYSSHYHPIYDEVESDFDLEYFKEGYYGIPNIDWLNAHHFDYRGLIPKGLALEAPEGMYNI